MRGGGGAVDYEPFRAVGVGYKSATVDTGLSLLDFGKTVMAVVNDEHLAALGEHKCVVSGTVDALFGALGENGVVFITLKWAER